MLKVVELVWLLLTLVLRVAAAGCVIEDATALPGAECLEWARGAETPAEAQWQPMKGGELLLGYTTEPVWYRLQLQNRSKEHLSLVLVVGPPQLDQVEAWRAGRAEPMRAGDHLAPSERTMASLQPALPVPVRPESAATVTVRIRSDSLMSLRPRLQTDQVFYARQLSKVRKTSLIRGSMVALTSIFLLLAMAGRAPVLAWYALHVALGLAYQTAVSGLLATFVALPGVFGRVLVLNLAALSVVAAVMYMRRLLETATWDTPVDRVLLACTGLLLTAAVAQWVLPPQLGGVTVTAALSLTMLTLPVVTIFAAWHGRPWGRLSTLSWTPLGLASIFAVISATGGPIPLETSLRLTTLAFFWQFATMAALLARRQGQHRQLTALVSARAIAEAERRATSEAALARSELQLARSQRSEALGRLAGGVAHDFNNLLSVIMGCSDEVMETTREVETKDRMREVLSASERAAKLVHQLLAYSKRQPMQRQPVDVHTIIEELATMLTRLLGARVALDVSLDASRSVVEADIGQLEQVLLNLAVNARDAMHGSGRLRLSTANVDWRDVRSGAEEAPSSGVALVVEVADTGEGIEPGVLDRIFEPFFTTKAPTDGTGLGLSMVKGIVEQHHGTVQVASELGVGTHFRLYFSTTDASATNTPAPVRLRPARRLRVLLAEDEDAVRRVIGRGLAALNYQVTTVPDGAQAIERLEQEAFDVLVSDMVMPGALGTEVAQFGHARHPDMVTVIISGYAEAISDGTAKLGRQVRLVPKPCRIPDIQQAIDELLGAESVDDEPSGG